MSNRRSVVLLIAGVVSLLLAIPALAEPPPGGTGRPRSSGAIKGSGNSVLKSARGGLIYGVELVGASGNTITVYDKATTGGTEGKQRWEGKIGSNGDTYTMPFPSPLVTQDGIYVEVEGSGATGFILFE